MRCILFEGLAFARVKIRSCGFPLQAHKNRTETSLSFQSFTLTELSNAKTHEVLRLLNRIKPIERLVPVD